jgi:hypothetical protein
LTSFDVRLIAMRTLILRGSHNRLNSIVTRPQAGLSGVPIAVGVRNFSLLENALTGSKTL